MRRNPVARCPAAVLHGAGGEQVEIAAQAVVACFLAHLCEHLAGALGDCLDGRIGRAHQGRSDGGFLLVQPVRRLAEQRSAQGVDADDFAAERHQVEVSLENLILAPASVQQARGGSLAEFLQQRAAALSAPQIVVDQPDELHADGRSAARLLVPQVAPGRRADGAPVYAAVLVETFVLTQDHGGAQGRRNIGEGDPFAASLVRIDAQAVDELAVTVEQEGFRRGEILFDLLERWHGQPGRRQAQATGNEKGCQSGAAAGCLTARRKSFGEPAERGTEKRAHGTPGSA